MPLNFCSLLCQCPAYTLYAMITIATTTRKDVRVEKKPTTNDTIPSNEGNEASKYEQRRIQTETDAGNQP